MAVRTGEVRFGKAEDLTTDEANRRADTADAMFQEFKCQIAAQLRKLPKR